MSGRRLGYYDWLALWNGWPLEEDEEPDDGEELEDDDPAARG